MWIVVIEGTSVGLYSAVLINHSMRILHGANYAMPLRHFLRYVLPIQILSAWSAGLWQIIKLSPRHPWLRSYPSATTALRYLGNTLSNTASLGVGLTAVMGDEHRLPQLSLMVCLVALYAFAQEKAAFEMRVTASLKYLSATISTAALNKEFCTAFRGSTAVEGPSENEMQYARPALWLLLLLSTTAYMLHLFGYLKHRNQPSQRLINEQRASLLPTDISQPDYDARGSMMRPHALSLATRVRSASERSGRSVSFSFDPMTAMTTRSKSDDDEGEASQTSAEKSHSGRIQGVQTEPMPRRPAPILVFSAGPQATAGLGPQHDSSTEDSDFTVSPELPQNRQRTSLHRQPRVNIS